MHKLRHIVVGTDFSACADQAVQAAITLGNLGLAPITLVHVCALSVERGLPEAQVSPARDQALLQACRERLAGTVTGLRQAGADVTGVLRTGRPWEKLSNVATEVGASLIVIGRHGHRHGAGPGLGSVAERLLRTSSRPILIVPGEPARSLTTEAQ